MKNKSSLNLLSTNDIEFTQKYPDINEKINIKKLKDMDPSIDEITAINDIIYKYVKDKKRKVYGGFALNKLLMQKNPLNTLYSKYDFADIDFYSPDPLNDLTILCDKLHEVGFTNISGKEAQHKETYSIFVNYKLYCDISYMPLNIYNKVRYVNIDEFTVIHPWFMMIDYFRIFTDPLNSGWRLEKHFPRFKKLEKNYPLPLISTQLELAPYKDKGINETINLLLNYLYDLESIIFTGYYVYNYYLYVSDYKKYNKNYEYVNIPYIEVYSINYIQDGLNIIEFIKTLPDHISSRITHIEHYPFFQFYGYNTVLYYNNGDEQVPILYLYSNNNKCISCKNVNVIKFNNLNKNKPEIIKSKINIGSFDFNILHNLIILVKIRVDDDNEWSDIIYKYINGLVMFRNFYFTKTHKNLYDDTIFESFVIDCLGKTIDPIKEKNILIQIRKKLGKPFTYRYEPGVSKKSSNYVFLNSSGNPIKKESNLKLIESNINTDIGDDIEKEELTTLIDSN